MIVRLGLDASLRIPTCAVSVDGEVILASTVDPPVEGFANVIREALREAGLQLGDVDEIVACVGPGSYNGVQTTVSTANALALAIGRPVTGVLSLDAVAVADTVRRDGLVAVPAGRQRWFVAAYHWSGASLQRDGLPQLLDDDPERRALRACGPNCEASEGVPLSAANALIVAERQGHLATQKFRSEVEPHLPPANVRGSR